MSTLNYYPVIVRDELIQDIVSDQPVEMKKGAMQNSYRPSVANSQSVNSVSFVVTPPSDKVVVNRNIKLKSTVGIRLTIPANTVQTGALCFSYGVTEALGVFPTNSLITNANVTINGASMSVKVQELLGVLMKMHEQDEFEDYYCPTMQDQKMASFSDMALTESDPLSTFLASKSNIVPRGSHPLDSLTIVQTTTAQPVLTATLASSDVDFAGACTCRAQATTSWVIDLVYTTIEPLLFLSPLLWAKSSNNAGLYGIHSFNLDLTLDPTAKRSISSATGIPMTASVTSVTGCELLMNYLTPQNGDTIASRNTLPYVKFASVPTTGPAIASGAQGTVISSNLTWAYIPSKIFVAVRKPHNLQTIKDSDSFMTIKNVSIYFNNKTLLNSLSQHDLYKMSKRNGSKQSIYEFFGKATIPNGKTKPTIGSVLVIDPALDLDLPEDLTCGTSGNYNFQITVTFSNEREVNLAQTELVVICQEDGVFVTDNGSSTSNVGLYKPLMVAEATTQQFGESRQRVKEITEGHSLVNVSLLNLDKSDIKVGSGVQSGGSFMKSALANLHRF